PRSLVASRRVRVVPMASVARRSVGSGVTRTIRSRSLSFQGRKCTMPPQDHMRAPAWTGTVRTDDLRRRMAEGADLGPDQPAVDGHWYASSRNQYQDMLATARWAAKRRGQVNIVHDHP